MYIDFSAPKYWIQTLFRGHSERDLWAMNDLIIRRTRKPLKAFVRYKIKHANSYPSSLKNIKEWQDILKKIEKAFDVYYKYEMKGYKERTVKQLIKDSKEMQEGFELFGKWFLALWD